MRRLRSRGVEMVPAAILMVIVVLSFGVVISSPRIRRWFGWSLGVLIGLLAVVVSGWV